VTLAQIARAWNTFWFAEKSPLPLALFRIFYGTLVLQFALFLLPDLFVWFGKFGILGANTIPSEDIVVRPSLFNFWTNDDRWTAFVFAILIVAAIFLIIGFCTRIASILIFLCLVSIYDRNPLILNSGDCYMRQIALWLSFSQCGKALSLDNYLAKKRMDGEDQLVWMWPQRLLQIQMCLVYCQSFFSKFWGDMWINGTAVYYSSRIEDTQRLHIPYVFDQLWTCQLLTWGTLAVEFSLFTLIWVKELRYFVLAAGLIEHLVIEWHMNIPQFEWLMISSYILFVDEKDLKWLANKVKGLYQQARKKTVLVQ
jgi:Vitamin K-dependent gamma-carboxylase